MNWRLASRSGDGRGGLRIPALAVLVAGALACLAAPASIAAVDDPDTIDALQAKPGKALVYMIIVQDRPWSPETHVMLGNKLSGYLRYALGGQMVRDTPAAEGRKVRIVLVAEEEPSQNDADTLHVMKAQVAAAGLEFVWGGEAELLDMVDEP